MRGLLLNLSLGFTLLVACGSPEPGAPEPVPYMPPAASAIVDASPVAIRREVIKVQVPAPPPNPDATANGDTPPAYNFVRLVRYRLDSQPALPARAIAAPGRPRIASLRCADCEASGGGCEGVGSRSMRRRSGVVRSTSSLACS